MDSSLSSPRMTLVTWEVTGTSAQSFFSTPAWQWLITYTFIWHRKTNLLGTGRKKKNCTSYQALSGILFIHVCWIGIEKYFLSHSFFFFWPIITPAQESLGELISLFFLETKAAKTEFCRMAEIVTVSLESCLRSYVDEKVNNES